MKSKILHTIVIVGPLLTAAACSESLDESTFSIDGEGYLKVSVAKNTTLDEVFTKADAGDDVIALSVYDSADSLTWSCEDCSAVTDPVTLHKGSYTAIATSGTGGVSAAFDSPFYSATQEFSIYKDVTTNLTMELTLAVVKVTASFSEDFDTYFSSYALTVSNGLDDGSLVYSSTESTLESEGYFSVTGTLTYTLNLVNTDGDTYSISGSYDNVVAKQHYALSFSIEEAPDSENGAGVITISVNDSLTEVTDTFTIVLADCPVISNDSSYDPSASLSYYAGDTSERKVHISMQAGSSSVTISHSDDALTALGLPAETELVGASDETIATLAALGIEASCVSEDDEDVYIDFTAFFSSIPAGTYTFVIYAENDSAGYSTFTANVEVNSITSATSVNAWARFATLTGKWHTDEKPDGLGFQYRTADSDEWTDVTATITTDTDAKTFTAELRGLSSETYYEFRTVCTAETETEATAFTTEEEGVVFNMDFDTWYDVGSYMSPNASSDKTIWDTANPGTSTIKIYPTSQETSHVVNGAAARLESMYTKYLGLIDVFAAGNIYTGEFQSAVISSSMGAKLNWGTPFTSRPLAMKGYYDYEPVEIDHTTDTYSDKEGGLDTGQIQVILTTWDEQFLVNTADGTFLDTSEDNEDVIGYGNLDITASTGSEYVEFILNIDWRRTDVKPTYIVIVAASSKYGDYFTGGAGSTLYVDEFEFIYDPAELDQF